MIYVAKYHQGYENIVFCCRFHNLGELLSGDPKPTPHHTFSLIYFKNKFYWWRTQRSILSEYLQWARFSYLHNISTKSYKYLVGFMSKYRYNTLRIENRGFKCFIKQLSQQIYKWKCKIEKKWLPTAKQILLQTLYKQVLSVHDTWRECSSSMFLSSRVLMKADV